MAKLIIKIDEDTFVLYLEQEKNICNYYGYKVCDEKIMPLPEDFIKILDIFKLSLNRKSLGIEDGYEVILDCDTNFKHYFKNQTEDFDKFILMNSEDLTVYENNTNNENNNKKKNKKYFRKFNLVASNRTKTFTKVATIGATIVIVAVINVYTVSQIMIEKHNAYIYNQKMSESLAYSSFDIQKEDIVNYIMNSPNLNEQEKALLINDDYLDFISPYLFGANVNIYLNDRLNNLDIVYYDDEIDPRPGTNGYYKGDNILHIKDYNENNPMERKIVIGHEFSHVFQNPFCSTYIAEAISAILTDEFFGEYNSYPAEVKNIKALMEIIGPEPLIKYTFTGDLTEIENLVKDYLEKDDFDNFIRIISSNINFSSKSKEDRNKDNEMLLDIIYRMYYNKYGKIDHDFVSLICNTDVVRYYFNPKFINEENSYYLELERTPIDLKTAYDKGLIICLYTKRVLYEDDSVKPEVEYENVVYQKFLYDYSEDIDDVAFVGHIVCFHHVTKGDMYMTIDEALDANYMYCIGYDITYIISYEESLNPEIKDEVEYFSSDGTYIENGLVYEDGYERHFVEPIDKKFPHEEQFKNV